MPIAIEPPLCWTCKTPMAGTDHPLRFTCATCRSGATLNLFDLTTRNPDADARAAENRQREDTLLKAGRIEAAAALCDPMAPCTCPGCQRRDWVDADTYERATCRLCGSEFAIKDRCWIREPAPTGTHATPATP
jgi:hypothetical protein